MASIFSFDDFVPVVHESAFVHPNATVVGNVIIGRDVYVGPGAVIRGDWGGVEIADGCNVQEGCVIHMFPGVTVRLEESAHIGHGAVVHGAHTTTTLKSNLTGDAPVWFQEDFRPNTRSYLLQHFAQYQ